MSATLPIPPEAAEAVRLAAVRHYEILDAPPDGAFADIAALAAAACNTPIATVSIVDAGRVWFAATYGLNGVNQIGAEPGLCVSAILRDDLHVVADAALDPRTLDHPAVRGELGLRFYAAAPIITAEGHRLGTVNVIDRESRLLTDSQGSQLGHLARVVARHLDVRLAAIHAGLFGTTAGSLNTEDLVLGQAFAHVAAVALVAGKAAADSNTLNVQLQTALTSRVVIEQAKGILAQIGNLQMDQAFAVLRGYARHHNQHLSGIAEQVVSRALPAATVLDHARAQSARERARPAK